MFITPKKGENPNIPKMATIIPAEVVEKVIKEPSSEQLQKLYKGNINPDTLKMIKDSLKSSSPPLDEAEIAKQCAAYVKEQQRLRQEISDITGFDCKI